MSLTVYLRLLFVFAAAIALSGCELAGDIFQAGVALGVFVVLAVVAAMIYLFSKLRRRV